MMNKVYYKSIYGRIYAILGVIFTLVFLLGTFVLNDLAILVYVIFSGFMIYLGIRMQKQPYAEYNKKELKLYSLWGGFRKRIEYQNPTEIQVKNNQLYYKGKKIRLNDWFVNEEQWQRMMRYYSEVGENELMDELKEEV